MTSRGRTRLQVAAAVLATLAASWLALNLTLGNKQVDHLLARLYPLADPQFARAMSAVLSPALVGGNRVEPLVNGVEIFPAMLGAIRAAQRSITFETYIYWQGTIGREFSDALIERARAGVAVHVLLDWIGGAIDDAQLERMREAGIQVQRYNAPHWTNLTRLNNRTHRKLLVVDGRVGFIGGVGIGDVWRGDAQQPGQWRDTHFRAEGPVVTQLQSAFIDNWLQAHGEVLHGDAYLPPLEPAGAMTAQVFTSAPGGGAESMQLMVLMSLTAAQRSIDLSASYFVPDNVAVQTLVAALRRGVRVRILLPGPRIDFALVRRASRATWGPLLEAGAQIHEFEPTILHAKTLVVDGLWSSVGSTNFDTRSFSINDEANMNVLDAGLAQRLIAIFEADLLRSRRITFDAWRARPWTDKLLGRAAAALSSQL